MKNPTTEYISFICKLYNDRYDDREENTAPPARGRSAKSIDGWKKADGSDGWTRKADPSEDWMPGSPAKHKSLEKFRLELEELGIRLSTAKIRKILITGGLWTTTVSREIQGLYEKYKGDVERVAQELGVSTATVYMNLPYDTVVYNLENPSPNARRIRKHRERKRIHTQQDKNTTEDEQWSAIIRKCRGRETPQNQITTEDELWSAIVNHEGESFRTSGRGSRPGIDFTYTISRTKDGRLGKEMRISTKEKTVTRATVVVAWKRAVEGNVSGPKSLGVPGAASYLYPVFLKIGVIKK